MGLGGAHPCAPTVSEALLDAEHPRRRVSAPKKERRAMTAS
jgi:hypothetical protein